MRIMSSVSASGVFFFAGVDDSVGVCVCAKLVGDVVLWFSHICGHLSTTRAAAVHGFGVSIIANVFFFFLNHDSVLQGFPTS